MRRSISGRILTKGFTLGRDGRIRKSTYDNDRLFSVATCEVNGPAEFASVLRWLEADSSAFILHGAQLPRVERGRARGLFHPDSATADGLTLEAAPRAWAMVDLDGVPCAAGLDPRVPDDPNEPIEHLVGLLPREFHDASCFWQRSASRGVPDRIGEEPPDQLPAHLFFWLEAFVPASDLRRWITALRKDGLPIHPMVFAPAQPHSVAAPISEPLQRRSGFRRGLIAEVPLVLPPPDEVAALSGHVRGFGGADVAFLERIGPAGYQEPIKAAVAACFAEHGWQADSEHLREVIRERIGEVQGRPAAQCFRDRPLQVRPLPRGQDRLDPRAGAGAAAATATVRRCLPPYFAGEAADRDAILAEQEKAIRGWFERNLQLARAQREVDHRREAAQAEAGLAGDAAAPAAPEAEVSRRKAAISRRARREVLADFGLQQLPKDGERLLITGAQGTGKSRTVAETVARSTNDITIHWLVPTLRKAEEQASEYARLAGPHSPPVRVVRGRGAPDPETADQAMCPRHVVVKRAAAMDVPVQEAICRNCRLREQCGYQKQRSDLRQRQRGLFVATSDYLWLPCPAPRPDLLIVDESIIGKAAEVVSLKPFRLTEDDKWANRDLDLALRNRRTAAKIRVALVDHPGRELAFLRQQGITSDDLSIALKHLSSREELRPEVDGQMSDAAIAQALDAAELRETRKVLILIRQIRRELEQPRTRLNSIAVDSGRDGLDPCILASYLRTPRLKQTTPVLALDGTGPLAFNRKVFREHMTERRFAVPRDAEVIQVRGKVFSRQSLTGTNRAGDPIDSFRSEEAARLRARVLHLLRTLPGRVLLITYKAVEQILKPDLPARVCATHFGAVRGLNSFEHCETVVVLGREQPPPQAIEAMTRPFAATDPDPLIPFKSYVLQSRAHRLRGADTCAETVFVHPDPRCQEMLEQVREAEIVQAVDRVRPVFNRRRVVLLTNLPVDITVDRVMPWQDLQPSRFAVAFARHGVLPLSACDLMRVFPDLWGTEKAVARDLERQASKISPKPQMESIIWGSGIVSGPPPPWLRCTYRRLGQRGPLARALLRHDLADPRATLEALVGYLSTFLLDHEDPRP